MIILDETDSEFEDGPDNSDFAMATVVKAASDCVTKKTVVTAEIDNFPASQTDISSSQESDVRYIIYYYYYFIPSPLLTICDLQ